MLVADKHSIDNPKYHYSQAMSLPFATNSALTINNISIQLLKSLLAGTDTIKFKKAGVIVTGIIPEQTKQFNLFLDENPKHLALMKAMDKVNGKMGSRMIRLGTQAKKTWDMKQDLLSPQYTTNFSHILTVKMPRLNTNIPLSVHPPDFETGTALPFVTAGVSAGFASPAQDFMEFRIDLNEELTHNKLATFYIRVSGNSMTGAGIDDGDLLVVDRSLEPADGKIAVCLIDGDFTVKRLKQDRDCLYLMPENKAYPPIKVSEDNQFTVWGIVTYVIKQL